MMDKHIINMTKNLSLSYEIALSLQGNLKLQEMLQKLLETVVRKGEAFRGLVWLLEDKTFSVVAATGSFTRGMDYYTLAKKLQVSLRKSLKENTPLLKTADDIDFLQYCIPFTGNEKEVLMVPIADHTVLQLFFTYQGAANQGLARVLEGLRPKLSNAIAACQNYQKLLDLEIKEKNSLQVKYFDLMNNLNVGIFIYGLDSSLLDANPALLRLVGASSIDELGKKSFSDICGVTHELKEVVLRDGQIKNQEVLIKRLNGTSFWATLTGVLRPLKDGHYIMGILNDIDERKRFEEKLKHLATYDSLTNIPNRYSLEQALRVAVDKAKTGLKSALLLIDLDNFKLVNDTLGHTAGDELLVHFTKILKKSIQDLDFVARLGGDEFAVIIESIEKNEVLSLADRIRNAVYKNEVLVNDTIRLHLSISIGIILIDGTLDYQKALSKADIALYKAKEEGRNRVAFIDPHEDASLEFIKINHQIQIIKKALREEHFVLNYQPIVQLNTGEILHYEALIRLQQNNLLIAPGEFIPVAERFGLMGEIDLWVVQAALKKLSETLDVKIFVNLSAASLYNKALLAGIEKAIINSGIDPTRLGFEITETSAMKDLSITEKWIRKLQKLGCRFALDDFGVGFSSFSYLMNLSVEFIKIDGSFVKKINDNPAQVTLVDAMNKVAHAFGKKTIAEYVENEHIARTLHSLNINCGQGYFFGKPSRDPFLKQYQELYKSYTIEAKNLSL